MAVDIVRLGSAALGLPAFPTGKATPNSCMRLVFKKVCYIIFVIMIIRNSQVNNYFISSKENVGATHKEQRQCTYVKD